MLRPQKETKTTADGRSKPCNASPYVAKGMGSDPRANGLLSGEPSTAHRLATVSFNVENPSFSASRRRTGPQGRAQSSLQALHHRCVPIGRPRRQIHVATTQYRRARAPPKVILAAPARSWLTRKNVCFGHRERPRRRPMVDPSFMIPPYT